MWTLQLPTLHTNTPPVVTGETRLYVLEEEGNLFAIDDAGSHGSIAWKQKKGGGAPYKTAPLVSADGSVYFVGEGKDIYAFTYKGKTLFKIKKDYGVKASLALYDDQMVFIVTETELRAFTMDGDLLYSVGAPNQDKLALTPPVVDPARQRLFLLEKDWLHALDLATGALQWSFAADGDLDLKPAISVDGDVHVADKNGRYYVIDSSGGLRASVLLSDKAQFSPLVFSDGTTAVIATGESSLSAVGLMPTAWYGTPDVIATADPFVWDFSSPASIDVGADQLQDEYRNNGVALTGKDVTVAVIDSGVYFDRDLKDLLGDEVEKHFEGQADFVGSGQCPSTDHDFDQYAGYCWTDEKNSADPFGHGSHVAGIIWNQFIDADTGVHLGIAPEPAF